MTDDQNFILDKHPQHENIFIAGGFSGTGFKFALTIGKIINEMVHGREVFNFDLKRFSVSRKILGKGKL